MPNPISLDISKRAQVHVGRDAAYNQRLTFESSDVAFLMDVYGIATTGQNKFIIHLDPGRWTVKHEFKQFGEVSPWLLGKGKVLNHQFAYFDDGGENEGDHDFNDVLLRVYYNYNDPGIIRNLRITPITGTPNLQFKSTK
ncbi:hypothetical protein [uncultured Aliiroseovarius sp.]|uniref:hypothetical protein n=1 Tax=uncultured Aliiroseovarius sp. TaxID=1658783 RepID=UPI002602DFAA|nr:hypothetical protein [uncultured Aliiroseovarius sp.]